MTPDFTKAAAAGSMQVLDEKEGKVTDD